MVESLSYTYTSEAEIKRLMTSAGYTEYVTDDQTAADVLADVINQATDEINVYCCRWYAEVDLANNSYVRRLATYIAAYHLTNRRGEEPRYTTEYQDGRTFLEKVMSGLLQLPRCPQRADLTPCHSNYVIDDRFQQQKVRVQDSTSSGPGTLDINPDITFNNQLP